MNTVQKNLVLTTLFLCTMFLPVMSGLAINIEMERKVGSVYKTPLKNAILYDGTSNTIAKNSIAATTATTQIQNKNPWLAFGLSLLVPGGGQWYNGHKLKAIIHSGLYLGGYGIFFLAIDDDILLPDGTLLDVEDNNAIGGLGILIAGTTWLWSVIDAPISANNINMQNQIQALSSNRKGYELSPFVKHNQLGARFTLRF